jgi:hypothetical protein
MKTIKSCTLVFCTGIVLAGGILISHINEYGLNKHANQLLKKYNIKTESLSCQMRIDSREGFCQYTATSEQSTKLAKALNLKVFKLPAITKEELENRSFKTMSDFNKALDEAYRFSSIKEDLCWIHSEFIKTSQVEIYVYEGSDPQLYIGNGQRFDKFSLLYSPSEKNGCFVVKYAYG